ncbi:hypothetical protein [Garciella nitratireducens]|uniref:hypothetical protein n=1 Tax=Garciella nitratireducens TaxID=218205 RepID=UPI000DEB027B|nr:hypothetical protein [Garciella nitratireducens]RBP38234.1 hypothetical protein DFR81_12030 [Garciella nitratireducens]
MNEIKAIVRKQYYEFLYEKKNTLLLIVIIGAISGFLIPVLSHNLSERIQMTIVAIFSITLLKQWSAESFASEKENNTLESILSTPIDLKKLYWVEMLFNLLLVSLVEYTLIIIFSIINHIINVQPILSRYEALLLILLLFNLKVSIAIVVTFISLTSKDVRIANSRASKHLYIAIFLISIVVTLNPKKIPYITSIYICLIFIMLLINLILIKYANSKFNKIYFEDVLF